ncbi:MAG TPA: Ig-like domain-containing protein, partial [Gemmatimonadales bacterium]|nr:Ig-like domain-containing protein [Gemmatimonadales bacterium]
MPFTFKLSRRLARIRQATLLASLTLAACEKPFSLSGLNGPASIIVAPDTATLLTFQNQQFTAYGRTAAGESVAVAVTWSTSGGSVTPGGLYTAASDSGLYLVTATATSAGLSGKASVKVKRSAVASVTVAPASATLGIGGTQQFTATLKDSRGNVLTGRTITWAASAPSVATVNASGLGTGVAAGTDTITATSEGVSGAALVSVTTTPPTQVTYFRTNFTDGTTGPLDVYVWPVGTGSCAASTDYVDTLTQSTHSQKCTIVPGASGAAALQAWFGNGALANLPLDPSLDQDLFEHVRFVLGPGAAASIGGTTCTAQNTNSQFKVHKSVYGQAGSAWNGWVMSDIGPCSDGNIGLFSEAEMWTINGSAHPWPGTYPDLHEGAVYDVVYRYHRYTVQNCGTVAVWVNGVKVWDLACASYMGTTNGSTAGLLFWEGAVYLQAGLGPLTVYNLFSEATNYPVGAATASP